jgi:hypothetical protein
MYVFERGEEREGERGRRRRREGEEEFFLYYIEHIKMKRERGG